MGIADRLLALMLNDCERERLLEPFANEMGDLAHDGLTDYFQDEHGDRDALSPARGRWSSREDATQSAFGNLLASVNAC